MKVVQSLMKSAGLLLILGVISACMQLGASERPVVDNQIDVREAFVQCNTPRPEICYEIYQPVCAIRDTGVRCVTTPCPSTEKVTYANDCKACAEANVHGFQRGDCNTMNTTGLDEQLKQWLRN